jgi:hypothetical protein
LEELKVNYDMTVRDSAGCIVQFLYGEDGLDPTSASLLGGKSNQMQFLSTNHRAILHKYNMNESTLNDLNYEAADTHHKGMKVAKEIVAKLGMYKHINL